MTQLSPAAQAVMDAAKKELDYVPIRHVQWVAAAALKALADQVVPQPRLPYDSCCDVHAAAIRAEILVIATELRHD